MKELYEFKNNSLIPINLQFFAGEKTEKPTAKKRTDARKEGQVANSQELGTAFLFLASFFALSLFAAGMYYNIVNIFNYAFSLSSNLDETFSVSFMSRYISYIFAQILILVAPVLFFCMLVGILSSFIQVGWHPTSKPLNPKLNRLNPISGFKRMFSMKMLVDLIKAIAKFIVVGAVIYNTVKKEIDFIPLLVSMDLFEAVMYIGKTTVSVGLNVGNLFVFIALADIMYTRYKHTKDLRMSKQEIKDEHKNAEGDPLVRGKIKQKMREISMRRMMQDVPSADVIITNPTHYSVAVKYDKKSVGAPIVVAKGVDFVAKKIREVAKENNVEIVENKQLARALYASVDIGKEIPPELYQAVAEVLAFVYRLKNKV